VHYSDGVKSECHLSAATVAEMTPFTDVPNSTPHVQLPGFSTLCVQCCLTMSRPYECEALSQN